MREREKLRDSFLQELKSGNDEQAINILERDKDIGINMALIYACDEDRYKVVDFLLANGATANFQNDKGDSALMFACYNGNAAIVDLLLKNADVNLRNDSGDSALMFASCNGDEAIAKLLLGRKANIEFENKDRKTALGYAEERGHLNIVRLITDYNKSHAAEEPEIEQKKQLTESQKKRLRKKKSQEANNSQKTEKEKQVKIKALHDAVKDLKPESVRSLLEGDIDVNAQDELGNTALHYSLLFLDERYPTQKNCVLIQEILELLANKGADFHLENKTKRKPIDIDAGKQKNDFLLEATTKRGPNIVKLWLSLGANVNFANDCGDKALVVTCLRQGSPAFVNEACEVIKELLKQGAKINSRDKYGNTPLMTACKYNYNYIEILLDAGADAALTNNNNETAMSIAKAAGNYKAVQLLEEYPNKKPALDLGLLTPGAKELDPADADRQGLEAKYGIGNNDLVGRY